MINVLESIDLLERSLSVKRGVQWRGPPLTDVALPPGCPRVEPTRFKDLLRKQPIRKRAAAELLAVNGGKKFRADHGVRRSAHAARGAVFARLEDPMRRSLHHAIEDIESQLSWQPPKVYTLMWHVYAHLGRYAHPVKVADGCEALLEMHGNLQNIGSSARPKINDWAERTRTLLDEESDSITEQAVLDVLKELNSLLRTDQSVRSGGTPPSVDEAATGGLPPAWAKGEESAEDGNFDVLAAAASAIDFTKLAQQAREAAAEREKAAAAAGAPGPAAAGGPAAADGPAMADGSAAAVPTAAMAPVPAHPTAAQAANVVMLAPAPAPVQMVMMQPAQQQSMAAQAQAHNQHQQMQQQHAVHAQQQAQYQQQYHQQQQQAHAAAAAAHGHPMTPMLSPQQGPMRGHMQHAPVMLHPQMVSYPHYAHHQVYTHHPTLLAPPGYTAIQPGTALAPAAVGAMRPPVSWAPAGTLAAGNRAAVNHHAAATVAASRAAASHAAASHAAATHAASAAAASAAAANAAAAARSGMQRGYHPHAAVHPTPTAAAHPAAVMQQPAAAAASAYSRKGAPAATGGQLPGGSTLLQLQAVAVEVEAGRSKGGPGTAAEGAAEGGAVAKTGSTITPKREVAPVATAAPTSSVAPAAGASVSSAASDVTASTEPATGEKPSPAGPKPVGKVKMTELLASMSERLNAKGEKDKAAQITTTNSKYRAGEITYAQAMGRLTEVVGRELLVHEVTRLSQQATSGSRASEAPTSAKAATPAPDTPAAASEPPVGEAAAATAPAPVEE